MATKVKIADMMPKLREVAAFLPKGWTMLEPKPNDEHDDYARVDFQHENGARFDIRGNWGDTGKLYVSGNFHGMGREGKTSGYDRIRHDETKPSINVSPDKSADVIARDIARRFLPAFTELWGKVAERIAADENYHATSDASALQAAAGFGIHPDSENVRRQDDYQRKRNGEPNTLPITHINLGMGTLKASRERVTLELNVTPDLAAKIGQLITKHRAANPTKGEDE